MPMINAKSLSTPESRIRQSHEPTVTVLGTPSQRKVPGPKHALGFFTKHTLTCPNRVQPLGFSPSGGRFRASGPAHSVSPLQ